MDLSEFHWVRPFCLWLLVPVCAYLGWLVRNDTAIGAWESICDPKLLPFVLVDYGKRRRGRTIAWVGAIATLGTLALAGPTWQRLPQPVFAQKSSLVIAFDLSLSMGAADVTPSRLARAKFKVADLLQRRKEGQTALIVFADRAFTVTPLTEDAMAILQQLPVLTPALMPVQGSRPDRAIELADQLLRQANASSGDVLLVTDGIESGAERSFEDSARAVPWRVSVLGVGTARGAPVPAAGGGFLEDAQGQVLMAPLDEAVLQRVAAAAGGAYQGLTPNDDDLDRLWSTITQASGQKALERTSLQADRWYEQGPVLVALALLLALPAFRRGCLVVALMVPSAAWRPAHADGWRDWWIRPDQQGQQAMEEGRFDQAEQRFSNGLWKGAAQYRNGRYAEAMKSWQNDQSADGSYNLGNALARLGKFSDALQAYNDALTKNPQHEDARFNRDLVLKQQQQQEPKDQQQQGQQEQKQDSPDGKSGNKNSEATREQSQEPKPDKRSPDKQSGADEKSKSSEAASPTPSVPTPVPQENEQARESAARNEPTPAPGTEANAEPTAEPNNEAEQADEQWLRRIPDDPGGLLRRKFHYQYREGEYAKGAGQGW